MADSLKVINGNSNALRVTESFAQVLRIDNKASVRVTDEISQVIESTRIAGPPPRGLNALGWRFFQDGRYTDEHPLPILAGVKTQIPDDGKGMLANSFGTNSKGWLNTQTSRLFPDAIGDFFLYRVNFTVWPIVNNKSLLISFDIGTANPVFNERETLSGGAGVPTPISKLIPSGASAGMMSNGGGIYVTSEADCMISKISILAVKTFAVDPA